MIEASVVHFGILSFSSLFAMVNPISAAPIYVDLTKSHPSMRRRTAFRASVTALIALGLFATAGSAIFTFFGITVPAFQIVGGLLFTVSAMKTLQGIPEQEVTDEGHDPSVVPIGIPLIAGAGALSTVMVLAGQAPTKLHQVALWAAILVNVAITLVVLLLSPAIVSKVSPSGQQVMARVMGLLTAVIGVQFIINGATTVVSELIKR